MSTLRRHLRIRRIDKFAAETAAAPITGIQTSRSSPQVPSAVEEGAIQNTDVARLRAGRDGIELDPAAPSKVNNEFVRKHREYAYHKKEAVEIDCTEKAKTPENPKEFCKCFLAALAKILPSSPSFNQVIAGYFASKIAGRIEVDDYVQEAFAAFGISVSTDEQAAPRHFFLQQANKDTERLYKEIKLAGVDLRLRMIISLDEQSNFKVIAEDSNIWWDRAEAAIAPNVYGPYRGAVFALYAVMG